MLEPAQVIALRNAARQALDEDFSGLTSTGRYALAQRFVNAVANTWNSPFTPEAVRANPAYLNLVATNTQVVPMLPDSRPGARNNSWLWFAVAAGALFFFMRKNK